MKNFLLRAGLEAVGGEWAKAATLRLRFLYEAGKFDQVVQEAAGYEANEACKAYWPQVMYVSWVACRRAGKNDQAAEEQRKFLEKFSKHPLAAGMYFASAMEALAGGNYGEARRLLETIKQGYPDSRLLPKVNDVLQRLKATEK